MKRVVLILLCILMSCQAGTPAYAAERYCGNYRITFYCNCAKCCGKAGQHTASGTWPTRYRTVAAGKEFSFGTKLRIDGFEDVRIVEDRGVGNGCIDVFVPDHQECLRLGLIYRDVWEVEE